MPCAHCSAADEVFDGGVAESDLRSYRREGPSRQTRALLQMLREEAVADTTLLDIGGGVGAIQHELLAQGVRGAVHVDASAAYLKASAAEAANRGHCERVQYLHGDFVELAPQIAPADIVTLDRVICCYPDAPTLVGLSAARARQQYGVIFPQDALWMRLGVRLLNLFFWLRRNPFRVYVHPTQQVDAAARAAGLEKHADRRMGLWQIRVYVRPATGSHSAIPQAPL